MEMSSLRVAGSHHTCSLIVDFSFRMSPLSGHAVRVPLTAVHLDVGLVDATLPDLGGALDWTDIHRAKPSAPLTCRACGSPVSAKVSVRGMRFFAHRAAMSECPTNGETLAHRLLKIELAAAIRAAGWHAELEVAGNGWRADVLAASPDGARRMALEAQLASATVEEPMADDLFRFPPAREGRPREGRLTPVGDHQLPTRGDNAPDRQHGEATTGPQASRHQRAHRAAQRRRISDATAS